MKKKQSAILKWLLLAVFLLAAGCFYSCSGGRTSGGWDPSADSMAEEAPEAAETASGLTQAGESGNAGRSEQAGEFENAGQSETAEQSGNTGLAEPEGPSGNAGAPEPAGQSGSTEVSGVAERSEKTDQKLCYVYLCGEVNNPGVYTLLEGARVYEAIELAGGFTGEAAESWLNLAEPVCDSMKLEVPSRTQAKDPSWQAKSQAGSANNAGATGGGANGAAGKSQAALVNINTASLEELMTLKGIGASRAEDIVRYRQEAGGFTKIEDIMKVPGIKEAAFQKIKDNIIV